MDVIPYLNIATRINSATFFPLRPGEGGVGWVGGGRGIGLEITPFHFRLLSCQTLNIKHKQYIPTKKCQHSPIPLPPFRDLLPNLKVVILVLEPAF